MKKTLAVFLCILFVSPGFALGQNEKRSIQETPAVEFRAAAEKAQLDYKVKRAITSSLPTEEIRPALPVPENQWNAYEQMVQRARTRFENLSQDFPDYCCIVTMRENIDGELQEFQRAQALVRARPFSVYMKYISPDDCRGRELLYVQGSYNGRMIVTKGGLRPALAHITRAILPDSELAASKTNHKISEIGIASMMQQLIDVADLAKEFPACKISFFENAKVDKRSCTVIQIVHEPKSDRFPFYFGQIFVDNQWQIPVRFISYDWPEEGEQPQIKEEYTYTNIIPNVNSTDADFDFRNPRYEFKKDLVIPE